VDDLIEGIYRLLNSDEQEPVNIGNPHEMTILEFAQIVNEVADNKASIIIQEDKRIPDDPQVRKPDITKAKTLLGWEPTVDIREGLRRTISFFRQQVK
jgi:dTDP-glucose 4,6-dehydratase